MDWMSVAAAFAGCVGFGLLFHLRGRTLVFAALGGALGQLVYAATAPVENEFARYLFATLALSAYAECLARIFKMPVTCFQLVAIMPLVPGGGLFYTMKLCIAGEVDAFLGKALETLGIAGSLAVGILLVSSAVHLYRAARRGQAYGGPPVVGTNHASNETKEEEPHA